MSDLRITLSDGRSLTPADARLLAAGLVAAAERIEREEARWSIVATVPATRDVDAHSLAVLDAHRSAASAFGGLVVESYGGEDPRAVLSSHVIAHGGERVATVETILDMSRGVFVVRSRQEMNT